MKSRKNSGSRYNRKHSFYYTVGKGVDKNIKKGTVISAELASAMGFLTDLVTHFKNDPAHQHHNAAMAVKTVEVVGGWLEMPFLTGASTIAKKERFRDFVASKFSFKGKTYEWSGIINTSPRHDCSSRMAIGPGSVRYNNKRGSNNFSTGVKFNPIISIYFS